MLPTRRLVSILTVLSDLSPRLPSYRFRILPLFVTCMCPASVCSIPLSAGALRRISFVERGGGSPYVPEGTLCAQEYHSKSYSSRPPCPVLSAFRPPCPCISSSGLSLRSIPPTALSLVGPSRYQPRVAGAFGRDSLLHSGRALRRISYTVSV